MPLIENKDLPIIITPNKTNNIQIMIQNNKLDNNNNLLCLLIFVPLTKILLLTSLFLKQNSTKQIIYIIIAKIL